MSSEEKSQRSKMNETPEFLQYLQAWWYSNSPAAEGQPAPMTYEEVMNSVPRRRPYISIYADALDDASSSGDEGYDLEPLEENLKNAAMEGDDEDNFFHHQTLEERKERGTKKRDEISKVLALHHDLTSSREGISESKTADILGGSNPSQKPAVRLQRVSSH